MEKKEFNQTKYINEWKKKNGKRKFSTDINDGEMKELEDLLKKHNLTKASFLRYAIEKLKEEK